MNNFVFSNDPLLYQSPDNRLMQNDLEMRQSLDKALAQYQEMQRQWNEKQAQNNNKPQVKDRLGELDDIMTELDTTVVEKLQTNTEYIQLNNDLQKMIQSELMSSVRHKINENPTAISKMDQMKNIIKDIKKEVALEEKKNMLEINDYLKNFSDMTFDDYKKLKSMTHEK